jgi:hypothetical protein
MTCIKEKKGFVGDSTSPQKNTAPNSGVEKTMKLYNNILLQEIRKAKTFFTPQGQEVKTKTQDSSEGEDLTSRL